MRKRGPKSKFTDTACSNKVCKDHGIAGHGNRLWCKKSGFVAKSVGTFTIWKVNQSHHQENCTQRQEL